MGYVIKPLPKNKRRSWKLQHQSEAGGERTIKDIPEKHMANIGFSPEMTIEEARSRRDQINAQEHLKRHEERRVKIIDRLQTEEKVHDAYLPELLIKEFEEKHLFQRLDKKSAKRNKTESHWRAAKRILCELRIDSSDWRENVGRFYDYFSAKNFSLSYCQKVLAIMNRWGSFEARKARKFFEPVPTPRGIEQQRIADAYYDEHGTGKESDPLTPEMLDSKRSRLEPEHANWLHLSVWLGLRPFEVDQLAKPSSKATWYLDKDAHGVQILWVYQTKLKTIAREKRLKGIPLLFREQMECLEIILSKKFRRPLAKTTKLHFGEKVTCYGGRKGFTDLMLSKGQDFVHISVWMGHTSIDRTLKNYKNKMLVNYTKKAS